MTQFNQSQHDENTQVMISQGEFMGESQYPESQFYQDGENVDANGGVNGTLQDMIKLHLQSKPVMQ